MLTVPGDVLAGAALAQRRLSPRAAAGAVASSACLYLAGMALNDWADREVDAQERPDRPIPSGRVSPEFALGLAAGLTVAGIGAAAVAGASTVAVAVPLAATVWGYDLSAKQTAAGPVAMAGARTLNVLLGAGAARGALPGAAVVGAHTAMITTVSRQETTGASRGLATVALLGHAAIAGAAAGVSVRRATGRTRAAAALTSAGVYLAATAKTALAARREPTAGNLQRHVVSGIHGFIPLDATLLAAGGSLPATAAIGALWPLARRLSRRRSPT